MTGKSSIATARVHFWFFVKEGEQERASELLTAIEEVIVEEAANVWLSPDGVKRIAAIEFRGNCPAELEMSLRELLVSHQIAGHRDTFETTLRFVDPESINGWHSMQWGHER